MDDVTHQKKEFYEFASTPRMWELTAGDLLAACNILRQAHETCDIHDLPEDAPYPDEARVLFPGIMLCGMAIECLLKALWLRTGNRLYDENGNFLLNLKSDTPHDLVMLAELNGLTLSEQQRSVLKRLSWIISGVGRYPSRKNWKDGEIIEYWMHPSDYETCEAFVIQLTEFLAKASATD